MPAMLAQHIWFNVTAYKDITFINTIRYGKERVLNGGPLKDGGFKLESTIYFFIPPNGLKGAYS